MIMACGSCGGGGRRITKYRVTFNDGTVKDYLTRGEAEQQRTEHAVTRPVRAVSVAAPSANAPAAGAQ